MEVKINQVVLHLLDPGASEPVLSDRAMDMDADLYEYYTATLERAFASDEVKNCRFLPDSAFAAEMAQNQDFIDLSRRIAGVIFEQMLQYQAIPAGDLAVVDFTADGVPFYGVLKLNYRPGYTHHTELMGNGRFSSMVPQRTLLPGTPKADEAALIDRANGTVRLIEKKFTLDDRKDFYLSTRVFGCTEALQEKAKLKAVCETAVAAVKEAYPEPEALDDVPPFDGGTETAVELLGNGRFSSMVPQRTLLPGTPKADEAALIDRANGTVRLIEKKFTMDDKKGYYLSTRVFGCTEALQEKAKLKAVCETAVAAVKEAYPEPESLDDVPPFDGGTETAVELLVRNQAVDNQISVEDVRERIRENFPLAAPKFEEALAETGVQENDRVTVTPARIKKLESRSFKTESGIEIRIPAELCSSDDAVEFIHSATGGLSLLIKDVLV